MAVRKNPGRPLERVLGARIRQIAHDKDIRLSHIADRADVSRSVMWELLGGKMSPTLDLVQRLAEVLEVDPIELLTARAPATKRKR